MSESKHTPGPWKWDEAHHSVRQPNGDDVLVGPDYLANAALIAAAPETARQRDALLGAASELLTDDRFLRWGGSGDVVVEALRAAIADAKGEGS